MENFIFCAVEASTAFPELFFSNFLGHLFYRTPFEQIVRANLGMATVERNGYCRTEFIFCDRKHWGYFLCFIRKQANYTESLDK